MDFEIALRKISEKRKLEIENLPLYDDMPKDYLWDCKPLHIRYAYCSKDEFFVVERLSRRTDTEMDKSKEGYYIVYGKEHVYFYISKEIDEKYNREYGAVGGLIIENNDKINLSEMKKEILSVIARTLEAEYGLLKKNSVESDYIKGVVIYNGERL